MWTVSVNREITFKRFSPFGSVPDKHLEVCLIFLWSFLRYSDGARVRRPRCRAQTWSSSQITATFHHVALATTHGCRRSSRLYQTYHKKTKTKTKEKQTVESRSHPFGLLQHRYHFQHSPLKVRFVIPDAKTQRRFWNRAVTCLWHSKIWVHRPQYNGETFWNQNFLHVRRQQSYQHRYYLMKLKIDLLVLRVWISYNKLLKNCTYLI